MLTCCELKIKDTLHETEENIFFFSKTISANVMYTINTVKQCNEFQNLIEKHKNVEQVQIGEKEMNKL